MNLETYRHLRAEARRHARRAADADDLVQDALLIALEQRRSDDPAWLAGVIRNQAAMQARSAIRRRRREAAVAEDEVACKSAAIAHEEAPPSAGALLERLPPVDRRVAALALHGLSAEEIRWVPGIRAAVFCQRMISIRKLMGALPPVEGERGLRSRSSGIGDIRRVDGELARAVSFSLSAKHVDAADRPDLPLRPV